MTDRLERFARGLRRLRPRTPAGERAVLAIAAVLFAVSMVAAWRARPDDLTIRWGWVVATGVIGVPALLALNAAEYRITTRLVGHSVRWADTLTVAVASRAANLLPLPGAALVRLQALAADGASYGRAVGATTAVAIAWLAASAVVGAVAAAAAGAWGLAVGLAGTAIAASAGTAASVRRLGRDTERSATSTLLTGELLTLEVVMIVVRALRFWGVMVAFDLRGSVATAFVLPVAGVLASALGVFPSGLGIRELVSGALSGLTGDPPRVGVLASGLDRLVAFPVLLALTGVIAVVVGRRRRAPAAEEAA